MNLITIQFPHQDVEQPAYVFSDRVALISDCEPDSWATGTIIGLHIQRFNWSWCYLVKFDSPLGLTEECQLKELLPESSIPLLQEEWEKQEALLAEQEAMLAELPY